MGEAVGNGSGVCQGRGGQTVCGGELEQVLHPRGGEVVQVLVLPENCHTAEEATPIYPEATLSTTTQRLSMNSDDGQKKTATKVKEPELKPARSEEARTCAGESQRRGRTNAPSAIIVQEQVVRHTPRRNWRQRR